MANYATIEQYQAKLSQLEKDLLELKKSGTFGAAKKNISLKGVLKGLEVTAADVAKAKQSLFKGV